MGIAKIYNQKQSGIDINGIIEDYYAYAGESISAGDFVEFINGVAGQTTETSVDTQLSTVTQEGFCMSAVELSDNKVFIAHCYGGNYILYGTVVTVSGTTITAGTDTRINATANAGRVISAVALDENRVFIAHNYTSSCLYSTICTISGTTITVASTQALNSTTNTANCISTELLSNGNVFIAHCYGGNYHLYGMVVTINGTTITTNTDTELSSVSYSGYSISTELLPNGNVFIAHNYGTSYYLYGVIATINGTTITKGTDTSLSTTAYAGRVISTALLPTGKIFVAHSTVANVFYLYGIVCTINGTSISKGTDTQLSTEQYVSWQISAEVLPSGKVVIFHSYGNNEYYLYGMVCTINNTSITAKTDTKLNGAEYSGYVLSTATLKNGTIFMSHSNSNSYYLNAQIFGIDEANNVPTNNVTINEYETQVRKTTTSDVYGVAKTSGTGGDSTGHNDIVSIYTVKQTLASLPVGTLVKDPSSTFLGEPVIWKIADVNHEGYPSNSVTLISDKILAMRAFDAKEPSNSDSNRQQSGNNKYSVSNIRQWLNSDAGAGQWYSAQHSVDAPPNSDNSYDNGGKINPYDAKAGFLNSFSQNFKNALLDTTLKVVLNTVTDGGGSETVTDKMFLASNTEVGLANENGIAEGTLLSMFSNDASRISYCTTKSIEDSNYAYGPTDENTAEYWWLRTPLVSHTSATRCVNKAGSNSTNNAYEGNRGVRPLCNLPSSIKVTQDEDGIYKLDF